MRSDSNQDEDSTDDEADGNFDNYISSHRDSEPGIGEELSGSGGFGGFGGGSSGGGGFAVAVPKLLRKLLEQLAPLENVNWKDWFHDADEYYYCYGDEPLFEEEGGQVGARLLPSDHNRFHNRSDEPIDSSSNYDYDDDVEYLSTEAEKKEKSRRHSLTERAMLTARQLIEPSSHRRTSRSKVERSERVYRSKDETPEEKELRREERRIKKLERDARKAAEAAALLGIPRAKKHRSEGDKAKGKEILGSGYESKREKKPKVYHDEVLSGLSLRRPTMTVKRTGSPKREVRSKHLTHNSHSRNNSLNNNQDSSTSTRKHGSEHRHHRHHEHSSPESALSCGRCIKRQRRREERAATEAGMVDLAARLERSERPERGAHTTERDLRRRVEQEERLERSRAERMQGVGMPRAERRSRSKAVSSRAVSPPPRRRSAERQVEIIRARQAERAPVVRQIETIPARQAAERTPRQVEMIPARQTERALARRTEHVERPPRPVERSRARPAERVSTRHAEQSLVVRAESSRAATAQAGRAPPTEAQRPILGFMLEDKPEKLIECVTCMDDEIPAKEAAKLACGHWFCNECLKRLFTLSLTDPAHMPPKCCQSDHIPLKHVDKLLSYQNKKLWNKKYLEYTTANRIYCPTTDCGEWIQPKDIQGGIGQCQKCKNKVCSTCNGRAHGDGACPQDPDMIKFFETAQKHKYQKCYNCKAMVELERGCNHMTCHCTAQFCYVCGSKWKTCDCPWFNYEPGEAEREYVVPDWNAREPVPPPQVADRPQRGNRREQLREDEEVARRLAREMGPGEDLAREYYELPIDPLAALGTLGLGLRNGIRRLAADYVAGAPEPRAHLERRRGGAVAGPGLGLGLARATGGAAAFYGAAARPAPAQAAAVNAEANNAAPAPVPRRQLVHVPALQRVPPRSNFLTESQQAHVERYLAELDLDDAEPAVEAPFNQQSTADDGEPAASAAGAPQQLRRSNTERTPRRTEHGSRASGSASGSGVARRESDVGGRTLLSLAGIGLRSSGRPQLVGGGMGSLRTRS